VEENEPFTVSMELSPTQWVPGALALEVKRPGREA